MAAWMLSSCKIGALAVLMRGRRTANALPDVQVQMEELWQAARQEELRKQSPQGLLTKLRKNFK